MNQDIYFSLGGKITKIDIGTVIFNKKYNKTDITAAKVQKLAG